MNASDLLLIIGFHQKIIGICSARRTLCRQFLVITLKREPTTIACIKF